jgi:hypothetical protein
MKPSLTGLMIKGVKRNPSEKTATNVGFTDQKRRTKETWATGAIGRSQVSVLVEAVVSVAIESDVGKTDGWKVIIGCEYDRMLGTQTLWM